MSVMPAEHTSNGTAPARPGDMSLDDLDELGARIPFGSRPNQTMPPSWAAAMLTLLAERHQPVFSALLGEVVIGYRAPETGKRGRSKADETA